MKQKKQLTRAPWLAVLSATLLASSLMAGRTHAQQRASARQLQQIESVTALPGKAKRWALVIGVDKYRDPQISPLKGSDNDARTLAEALIRYAGFPADQVILMSTDQPEERQPTRVNLLRRLSNLASVVPKDGLLLISFAGHGMERNGLAYLLPSDAQISDDISFLEETAVSVARMKDRIRATGVGQVIVMLDACRNDPGGRADAPNQLSNAYVNAFNFDVRNREVQAFATLYATAVGQRAYEYTERRQGYFTWAVVEGLKGAAADENGEVTLARLVKYIQETVPKRIGIDLGGGKQQKPFAIIEGYRAEDLVIAVGGNKPSEIATATTSPVIDSAALEMSFWESIKNSTDQADFKAFLEKFPDGTFAALAKKRAHPSPPPASIETLPMPTIDQILDRYIQASGEKTALERLSTRVLKASVVEIIGQSNLSYTFEAYSKAPNKSLSVFSPGGYQQGFNGASGWIKNNGKLRRLTGEQLANSKRESEFFGATHLRELYAKISFIRRDKVNSREVYVLEATPPDGKPETLYFDTETALLLRRNFYSAAEKRGLVSIETYLDDYREVDGIKLPFSIRTVSEGYSITYKVYEVKHNIPIDDAKFDGPSKQ